MKRVELVGQAVAVVVFVATFGFFGWRWLTTEPEVEPPLVWEDPVYPVACYKSPGEPWQCLVVAVEYVGQQD